MAIRAAKRQAVAAIRYAVLAVADFATLFRGVGESCFLCKKVANGIKDLKTVKSVDLKMKGRPLPPKNVSPPLIARIPLKAAAHCRCLPGAASPGYVALDLCYIS
jgi:hypothetical protein